MTIATANRGRPRTSTDSLSQAKHAAALAARACTWPRDEEAVLADQTWYRLVIDAGHNEGTSPREDAGYDEKC